MNLDEYFKSEKLKKCLGDTMAKMAMRRGVAPASIRGWRHGEGISLENAFWVETDTNSQVTAREINEFQKRLKQDSAA